MNSVYSTSEKTSTEHADTSQNVSHTKRRLSCLLILLLICASFSFIVIPWVYFLKHPEKFEACVEEAMTEAMYRYFIHIEGKTPAELERNTEIPNYSTVASEKNVDLITFENPQGYVPDAFACLQCQYRLWFLGFKMAMACDEGKIHTYLPTYTVDASGKPLHSWRVLLLPYLGEESLYQRIRLDEPWDSDYNRQFWDLMPEVYACPSCGEKSKTPYCMIVGPNASRPAQSVGDMRGVGRGEVCGDTAVTLLLAERKTPVHWMEPIDIRQEDAEKGVNVCPDGIGSEHFHGAGAVTYSIASLLIPNDANLQELRCAITITSDDERFYNIPSSWRLEQFPMEWSGGNSEIRKMFSPK